MTTPFSFRKRVDFTKVALMVTSDVHGVRPSSSGLATYGCYIVAADTPGSEAFDIQTYDFEAANTRVIRSGFSAIDYVTIVQGQERWRMRFARPDGGGLVIEDAVKIAGPYDIVSLNELRQRVECNCCRFHSKWYVIGASNRYMSHWATRHVCGAVR